MEHHGYNLKVWIDDDARKREQIANVLKVSRQSISLMYGKEKFTSGDIEAINKAGLKIPGITAPGGMMIVSALQQSNSDCSKQIEIMQKLVDSKDQTIQVGLIYIIHQSGLVSYVYKSQRICKRYGTHQWYRKFLEPFKTRRRWYLSLGERSTPAIIRR